MIVMNEHFCSFLPKGIEVSKGFDRRWNIGINPEPNKVNYLVSGIRFCPYCSEQLERIECQDCKSNSAELMREDNRIVCKDRKQCSENVESIMNNVK
jgi:hypothetical protein